MSKPDVASRLARVDRLSGLSRRDVKAMAEAGTLVTLPANWSLMSENTPADKAYVIVSGEVAIRQKGETVATVGAGGIIGEVGIMQHRLRTAGVVSLTELEVVHFTNADLARLVDESPRIEQALSATVQEHLADDDE